MPAKTTPRTPCRGPSRRDLLRAGVLGLGGFCLGLDDLFRLRALAAGAGPVRPAKVKN
jgi:hypothetical protein